MSIKNGSMVLGAAAGVAAIAALAVQRRPVDFTDKVVLITGGSRGLGLVLARQFAEAGAHIAICARDEDEIDRAVADLKNRGADVFGSVCDVREQSQANNLIRRVVERFGKIDVLVNNAGVIQVGPLDEQTQADFEEAMAVHFWGPYYLIQAALPNMKKQGSGHIVNISSIGGKIAVPHLVPYSASKFALAGLSEGMGSELAKDNIRITTVYPGLMRTGSHINAFFKGQNKAEFALFSVSNALPISSVSAESAAAQILRATYSGDAELVISPQAKLAAKVKELFPELSSAILSAINRMLPGPGGIGTEKAKGYESESAWSNSILTAHLFEASKRNNETKNPTWRNKMNTTHEHEGNLMDFITNTSSNINGPERVASALAGGALVGYGLKQGGVLGTALSILGGGMLLRGATGHSHVYNAMGIDTSDTVGSGRSPFGKSSLSGKVQVTKSVTVNKSPSELYQFWHNFENLPQFMKHLESVSVTNEERSHWTAKSPIGDTVEWDAEITDDVLNEKIGWRSLENADIPNSGTVQFRPTVNRGTEIKVDLTYESPGGKLGSMIAKLFGEEPEQQIAEDLRRFKQLMETGIIITVKGQTSGREEMPKARAARA
jgi:Predicted integral membrane protein